MAERKEIDEIKAKCTAEDVARYCGKEPKSGFITLRGEKTPSVKLYSDHYHDYGDQSHGDVISLWMRITGDNFRTALKKMGDWLGVPIDTDTLQEWTRETETRKDRIQTTQRKAAQECRMLAEKNEGLSRDIADKEASEGYAQTAAIFRRQSEVELTGDLMEDEHNAELMISTIRLFGGEGGRTDADILENELLGNRPIEADEPIKIPDEDPWDDEEPDPPRFLWYPYLPHGKLTVVSARGGAGKGMFACLIAARISRGLDFGELESERYDFHALEGPAHTVYFSRGEDTTEIIRKRYRDSGGVKGYLHTFTEANKDFDIFKLKLDEETEFERFRGIVSKFDAKLIIFDTIDKFLNANENKKDEVQDALTKIQAFADSEGVSVLCILHDRKGGSGGNMADRVAGSREWTDVPRSVLHIDFDPEDPNAEGNRRNTNRRVVVPSKNNLAAWGSLKSVRFIIDGPKGAGFGRFPTTDDGCTFEANVTADDYELADLRKTTVRAILMEKNRAKLTAEARSKPLKDAIQSEVDGMEKNGESRRKYSYKEFEEKHGGKSVWGGELQRVKAIEFVSSEFKENGVFIGTHDDKGKTIRGRDGSAGFEITVTNP